jgi:hypothetical protein
MIGRFLGINLWDKCRDKACKKDAQKMQKDAKAHVKTLGI